MTDELAEAKRHIPYPGTEGAPTDSPHDMSHMVQISKLIANLQSILEQFGDTCVYVRRGGLSWGAVALNRLSDDEKFGLFDLQAEHDRVLVQRAGQAERLIADRNSERELRWAAEAELTRLKSPQPEHDRTVRLAALEEAAMWHERKAEETTTLARAGWHMIAARGIRSLIDQTGGEGGI